MKSLKNYILITAGSSIMGISLNAFLIPNKIAAGGISGIATILEYLAGFKPSLMVAIINIPLFILAFWVLGDKFLIKSIFGTIMLALSLEFLDFFGTVTQNLVLACVAGGVLMGLGLGLVLMADATTGGTEIVARLLKTIFPNASLGRLIMLVDSVIIIWSGIVFASVEFVIYAAISLYLTVRITDNILEGLNFAKNIMIVSQKSSSIAKAIMTEMERGVTGFHSVGMYSGREGMVLMCLIRRNELAKIKEIVLSIDKNAFVTLADVREVMGEGFK